MFILTVELSAMNINMTSHIFAKVTYRKYCVFSATFPDTNSSFASVLTLTDFLAN